MGALRMQCSFNSLERQFVRRLLKDVIRMEIECYTLFMGYEPFKNPLNSECDLEERSKEEFSVAVPTVACRSGLRYHNYVLLILFASERGILRTQTGCVDMKLLETCSFWECEMH